MPRITFALLLTLAACSGNAGLVRRDDHGGRVALRGAYMRSMADAHALMTETCGGRYRAREERFGLEFRCMVTAEATR